MGYRRRRSRPVRHGEWAKLPLSTFRFSAATLTITTIRWCTGVFPYGGPGQTFHLPQLKQLALVDVCISEGSQHSLIAGCTALEFLLLDESFGFHCLRINSNTLQGIGVRVRAAKRSLDLVIEEAPCLERLLCADGLSSAGLDVSVKAQAAPKLETIGYAWDLFARSRHAFGSTAFQGCRVISLTTVVPMHNNVRILSVHSPNFNLDMVIDLMKCFPCLEKLYIRGSVTGTKNPWRRKHSHFIQCSDIRLKTLVLERYRGTKSQVSFASFFLLNARELELMRLQVVQGKRRNEEFLAKQRTTLQMQKWAFPRCSVRIGNERMPLSCLMHQRCP